MASEDEKKFDWKLSEAFAPDSYFPSFTIDPQEYGRPKVRGNWETPIGDGTVGVEGMYQSRQQQAPDWSALIKYRRSF
jgi:hypothetical protein